MDLKSRFNLKAFIFDLDGVLTDTQKLHMLAWERMFNELLSQYHQASFSPGDYREYLDGKPRIDGIKSFLTSRKIDLNEKEMLELGLRKNQYYLEELKSKGPGLIEDSFSLVVQLARNNFPMAVVSSSRNCRQIMDITGLSDYIKVVVDPMVAETEKLPGKPAPDYFLKASELLGYPPEKCCLVEDAISGILAGVRGKFGKVVGIKVNQTGLEGLKMVGAHQVVNSLWEIEGVTELLKLQPASHLINSLKSNKDFFLFLDYDGTLSEIVEEPWKAVPVEGIVPLISAIGKLIPVCLITGRDTEVIKSFIDLPHIYYSTCHGFEINGPENLHYELEEARAIGPAFDLAREELTLLMEHHEGLVIERKTFGLAFHYRMIKSREVAQEIVSMVQEYASLHQKLKWKAGEEVIELLPNLNWDKGKALLKLYEVLNFRPTRLPIFLGDGKTDEDAFREMLNWGYPVLVQEKLRPTLASFQLSSPFEVRRFLKELLNFLEKKSERMDFAI